MSGLVVCRDNCRGWALRWGPSFQRSLASTLPSGLGSWLTPLGIADKAG